jgi:hypothetical protein
MEIQPLCPELIAKLEIAVAHRNRERAVAVIERHFEEQENPKSNGLDTPLAEILPMKQSSLLAREGYVLVGDLSGLTEQDLKRLRGIGPKFVEVLRQTLNQLFQENRATNPLGRDTPPSAGDSTDSIQPPK